MVMPRGHASDEIPESQDSSLDFLSVPSRTLVMPDAVRSADVGEPQSDAKTVVEREEWIRARDQIALVVRSTVAEAILPLQESIASIAERLDALASAERVAPPPPPSRATMLPPPLPQRVAVPYEPPMAPSALNRLGDLAGRLRRERGIDVSPMQLAALLLERVSAVLDERVAAELAKTSMLTELSTTPDDDPSS
ncbi:MAG TPA: hypothetical protein VF765_22570 [Polyangiaceae bacterium]